MRNYYVKGDWNALCQRCGFKYKASQLRLEWTNLYVCPHCWETRHPQDFVRGREDDQTVPWSSPEPTDLFINPGFPLLAENDTGGGNFSTMLLDETGKLLISET